MRRLLCWLLGHRWFNTVEERRTVLEYSVRNDWIYDTTWQGRICTRCFCHEANETSRHYLGDLEDLHTNRIELPDSWPESGLPMLEHPIIH